jgi:hypothetical protein
MDFTGEILYGMGVSSSRVMACECLPLSVPSPQGEGLGEGSERI